MDTTYKFDFRTMLNGHRGECAGFAWIIGECDYDKSKADFFDECYATIRIKSIKLKVNALEADGTLAYLIDKAMFGSYYGAIEEAIYSYMQSELYGETTEHYEPWPDDGSTDRERNPTI
jgi:hypothetical protein